MLVCWWWRWSTWPTLLLLPRIFILWLVSELTFCVASLQPTPTPTPLPSPAATTTIASPPTASAVLKGHSRLIFAIALGASLSFVLLLCLLLRTMMGCLPHFITTRRTRSRRRRDSSNRSAVVVGDVAPSPNSTDHYHEEDCVGDVAADGVLVRRYSWEDIGKATDNFSVLIGSGGFSTVYMATRMLGHGNAPVGVGAVKIHHASTDHLNRIFKQELDILIHLRHPNVVRLLGFCDDHEHGGALVLEYMPNGSLQDRLHQVVGDPQSSTLSWRGRVGVAFQLAQALEYLHEKCDPQIVHGDIKASNVLLDHNLNCKLCDFGSAKVGFSSAVASSPAHRQLKKMMVGSPGYTDPHYLRTGIASKKNDIYSYGVILLELVTGMVAFCPERNLPLASILGPVIGEAQVAKLDGVVDPRLTMGGGDDVDLHQVRTLLSLSALCLSLSPTSRPSATQILNTIKNNMPAFLLPPQTPFDSSVFSIAKSVHDF